MYNVHAHGFSLKKTLNSLSYERCLNKIAKPRQWYLGFSVQVRVHQGRFYIWSDRQRCATHSWSQPMRTLVLPQPPVYNERYKRKKHLTIRSLLRGILCSVDNFIVKLHYHNYSQYELQYYPYPNTGDYDKQRLPQIHHSWIKFPLCIL